MEDGLGLPNLNMASPCKPLQPIFYQGKSSFLPCINGPFSIAMLNDQWVEHSILLSSIVVQIACCLNCTLLIILGLLESAIWVMADSSSPQVVQHELSIQLNQHEHKQGHTLNHQPDTLATYAHIIQITIIIIPHYMPTLPRFLAG